MDDGLLLHDLSLALSDVAGSVGDELQPGVVSIRDHRAKSEESCRSVSSGVDGGDADRGDQVQQRPNRAEDQLDLNPRDSEETLDDVENVEHKQDSSEPEGDHRHRVEERAGREAGIP